MFPIHVPVLIRLKQDQIKKHMCIHFFVIFIMSGIEQENCVMSNSLKNSDILIATM